MILWGEGEGEGDWGKEGGVDGGSSEKAPSLRMSCASTPCQPSPKQACTLHTPGLPSAYLQIESDGEAETGKERLQHGVALRVRHEGFGGIAVAQQRRVLGENSRVALQRHFVDG